MTRIHPVSVGRMQTCLWLIVGILVAAAMITVAIGTLAAPRSMPDERHHYAVVKHITDHFGQFPLDYQAIRTDQSADPNHLVHPPLYHYLMASVYKVFSPDRHFTEAGERFDRYGSIQSSEAILPLLRGMSQFLVFFGFVGVFFLLKSCLQRNLLTAWSAVSCAVMLSFIAGFLYIGGGLNNDVLGLVLWPWLGLTMLHYLLDEKPAAFWQSLLLIAAFILTKASFWVLALGMGVLLAAKFLSQFVQAKPKLSFEWRNVSWQRCLLAIAALSMWALVFWHLGTQLQKYGKLQPNYLQVYNVAENDNKFMIAKSVDAVAPRKSLEIGALCAMKIMQSLRGTVSHLENIHDTHPLRNLLFLLLGGGLILLGSVSFWRSSANPWLKALMGVCLVLPAANFAVLYDVNINFYGKTQNFAAEGRYFIGHLHFAILALFIITTHVLGKWKLRKVSAWSSLMGLLMLGILLVQPFSFFENTHEVFFRAKMGTVIPQQMQADQYRRVPLAAGTASIQPYRHLKWYSRLGDYFPLRKSSEKLSFPLPPARHDWELAIWVEAPRDAQTYELHLNQVETPFAKPQDANTKWVNNHSLPVPAKMSMIKVRVNGIPFRPGSFWEMSPEITVPAKSFGLEKYYRALRPRAQPLKVFAVFAKPIPIPKAEPLVTSQDQRLSDDESMAPSP